MEEFSDLDAVFWAGETPTQHLHILATLVLARSEGGARWTYETFRARVAERFQQIDPLTRRALIRPFVLPAWVEDGEIHLDRHLHHVVLDGGGLEALAEVAAEIASYPLPRDRPLWEAWFVEGMNEHEVATIAKVHHSVVDGVSGIFTLAAFFDLEPEVPPAAERPRRDPEPAPSLGDLGRTALASVGRRPAAVLRSSRRAGASTVAMLRRRSDRTPLPFTGPRQRYNRTLTPRRSVAFTTVPLSDVKRIARHYDVPVNDVLVAVCAGVLRTDALKHGETPTRPLVAAIPVSEREPEDGLSGNQISTMFYSLPVHVDDAVERIRAVGESATSAKDLHAQASHGLMKNVAVLVPKVMLQPALRLASLARAADRLPPFVNVLISNIKGPDIPLFVAGASLKAIYPMGPLIEGVGLGITIVTYRDQVAFGFLGCPDQIDDIQPFADRVHTEVDDLLEV